MSLNRLFWDAKVVDELPLMGPPLPPSCPRVPPAAQPLHIHVQELRRIHAAGYMLLPLLAGARRSLSD